LDFKIIAKKKIQMNFHLHPDEPALLVYRL
jgi:hypothetical protein